MIVTAKYPTLVKRAADAYLSYLKSLVAVNQDSALGQAAIALATMIEVACQKRDAFQPADVTFSIEHVNGLKLDERKLLLNQNSLGLGRDNAGVVVVGTEHGYELGTGAVDFTLQSCCDQVLWLTGGRQDIVQKIIERPLPTDRPFHIYPNDYFGEGGSHTWVRLAAILGETSSEYRRSANPGLGDLCYQIELSAYPSQNNVHGLTPTDERLSFLQEVVTTLRGSARVLLFHGRASDRRLEPARETLASLFLGVDDVVWTDVGQRYRPIRFADAGERRVIITRAIGNSGVTPRFINRVAALADFASVDELPGWENADSEAEPPKGKDAWFLARRKSLLDEAAAILREELGIRMHLNQGKSSPNGRIGTFVADVKLGVVVREDSVAVHLHSLDEQRQATFSTLLSEFTSGALAQPARDLTFNIRPGERKASKLYLETVWPFSDDDEHDDGHAERLAAVAAWLRHVRNRFA